MNEFKDTDLIKVIEISDEVKKQISPHIDQMVITQIKINQFMKNNKNTDELIDGIYSLREAINHYKSLISETVSKVVTESDILSSKHYNNLIDPRK